MEIIWLMVGYSVGVLTGVYVTKKMFKEFSEREKHPAPSEKDKAKILKLATTKEKITNDDVEKLLEVSDSTAQRYLQKIVGEGSLKRHGKTGRKVFYTKN